MELTLGFVELLGAVLLLTKAISGASWYDIITGKAGSVYRAGAQGTPAPTGGISGGTGGMVNPIPGATASRLDQGIDATGHTFLAPFDGTVVYSSAHDAGWAGGGYIAIANAANPHDVWYLAEGIIPTVFSGAVRAGQSIAVPTINPYNGVYGNVELGPADPASPGRPLAQAVSDPVQTVLNWYHRLLALGGPQATSTGNAGHA